MAKKLNLTKAVKELSDKSNLSKHVPPESNIDRLMKLKEKVDKDYVTPEDLKPYISSPQPPQEEGQGRSPQEAAEEIDPFEKYLDENAPLVKDKVTKSLKSIQKTMSTIDDSSVKANVTSIRVHEHTRDTLYKVSKFLNTSNQDVTLKFLLSEFKKHHGDAFREFLKYDSLKHID